MSPERSEVEDGGGREGGAIKCQCFVDDEGTKSVR